MAARRENISSRDLRIKNANVQVLQTSLYLYLPLKNFILLLFLLCYFSTVLVRERSNIIFIVNFSLSAIIVVYIMLLCKGEDYREQENSKSKTISSFIVDANSLCYLCNDNVLFFYDLL